MIRTVLIPQDNKPALHVPNSYIGKKVEVIAFVMDEAADDLSLKDKTFTHFASETALAKDWLTPEEDKTWQDL